MERPEAHDRVRNELARGEYLLAYDIASEAAGRFPDDRRLRFYTVLALARSGAVERAAEQLETSDLDVGTENGDDVPVELVEDIRALGARLTKDQALRATGRRERRRLALDAASRYELIFRDLGRHYACINAATMYLLAGDETRAAALARTARELAERAAALDGDDAYWSAATAAEAALVLGEAAAASRALERAAAVRPADLAARATTRRQLRLVCEIRGIDTAVLAVLSAPTVVHYCGHMASNQAGGRFPVSEVERVAGEVEHMLGDLDVGFAYGSLASGADVIVAERVLARGAELHVFLPFEADEFVATSVRPAGEPWVARFDACLASATSVTRSADGPYASDDVLFDYCARVAQGRALIRGDFLDTGVSQIALWDGADNGSEAGTASDVRGWRSHGHVSHVIDTGGNGEATPRPVEHAEGYPPRAVRAMLFADFKGYSKLSDRHLPAFHANVLAAVAATLARYDDAILYRNTWGDGLHIVFRDVVSAAHCAIDLQETIAAIDATRAQLPDPPQLRIAAHIGPVYEVHDAVRGAPGFVGTHITRTARIEPRTPEGSVYVTDPFAAMITLAADATLTCQYVGHIPTAKEYGTFPMYVLKASSSHRGA